MHNKKWIVMCVVIFFPTYSIQKSTLHIATGVTAIASLCAQYTLQSSLVKSSDHILFCIANVGFLYGMYSFLYSLTPEGRLKEASDVIDELHGHTLARVSFENENPFFDTLYDVYLTDDLPLIGAYNHLIDLLSTVHYVHGLINYASAEIGKDTLLQEKCDVLLFRSKKIFTNIAHAIKRIRAHKDYLPQLRIYKEFIAGDSFLVMDEHVSSAYSKSNRFQKSTVLSRWLKMFW